MPREINPLAFDFLAQGPAQVAFKRPIQAAAAHAGGGDHVVHADRLAKMLPDEAEGLGHVGVLDGQDVAAAADHQTAWRHQHRLRRRREALHQAVQQLRPAKGILFAVAVDAGDGHGRELAGVLVVVDADDGDLLRHGQAGQLAGVEHFHGPMIALGHHG